MTPCKEAGFVELPNYLTSFEVNDSETSSSSYSFRIVWPIVPSKHSCIPHRRIIECDHHITETVFILTEVISVVLIRSHTLIPGIFIHFTIVIAFSVHLGVVLIYFTYCDTLCTCVIGAMFGGSPLAHIINLSPWWTCNENGSSILQLPFWGLSLVGFKVSASDCIVSVSPTLEISEQPSVVWNLIGVTCQVNKFYPSRLRLTWLENGNISHIEDPSTFTVNKDGTYSWTSWHLVNVSAHEEDIILTCQVEHDQQPPEIKTHTVMVSARQREQGISTMSGKVSTQTSWLFVNFSSFLNVKGSILIIVW